MFRKDIESTTSRIIRIPSKKICLEVQAMGFLQSRNATVMIKAIK